MEAVMSMKLHRFTDRVKYVLNLECGDNKTSYLHTLNKRTNKCYVYG